MLIYAPSTPRLQLELGVLYYKIGAYDVARNYFEQALANRNVQPEVAQQIKLCLQQLSLIADPPPFSANLQRHPLGEQRQHLRRLAVARIACSLSVARADKVGVAAAVNPDAFSSLEGAPKAQLNIGKSIFYDERINTSTSGFVQVLLVDGSTFTVGPGSDLVIDKFVYDPKKNTGEMVATFSKGVMRFVGG
ncbi:MAG TPA: hypothetical protein VFJ49_12930 [Methyloceanibacter sp.]|nr:hypothetical protein [Methyloceanibacter sp.]